MVFADRDDAGRRLAARLGHLRGEPVVVLGLPRGGVTAPTLLIVGGRDQVVLDLNRRA
jgi:predicted phosphoribosyltransferase